MKPAEALAGTVSPAKDPLVFRQVPREASGCLAYLVGDAEAREAALVDVPEDPAPLLAEAQRLGLRITAVIETHTHADHRSGARALAAEAGARLLLPERSAARFPHDAMRDDADVRVGSLRIRAVHTPGHTPDAMTLLLPDRALVGDALLVGTAGRADFYDRGPEDLYHSLFDKLLKLDDAVAVYPAHFGARHGLPPDLFTTVGKERRSNEALTQRTKEDFVRYMTEGWPPKPHGWEAVVRANNGG